MTEKDTGALAKLVADSRRQMESDLSELFEELGPALLKQLGEIDHASQDPADQAAAAALKPALQDRWEAVTPKLMACLAARSRQAGKSDGYGAAQELKIVNDAEVTLQLAAREVVERLTTACREETNPLERRVTYLVLRSVMKQGDPTFKLASLWSCIETACAEVTDDTAAGILLLQLVGKHLAVELPQLYRVVNEALIDADILPRLKRSYREMTLVDPQERAAETARMESALDRLVKARTKEGSATATGDNSLELFDSMKMLQAAPVPAKPGTHTNIVRMARDSGAARDVRPQESVTLDIVAELFDLLFGDPNVAEGIKALVARLQTTVLKAAMLNKSFFADHSHPARRFLDSISSVAIRWGKTVNADDPFYLKLSELVDRIQATNDGNMSVFEAANADLDAFLAEREKIEEQQDRELADAVHAREEEMRLTRVAQMHAQRAANHCIERLLGPQVPSQIEEFLRSYWRDVVQGRIVQAGEDGAPTKDALQTVVALIWAVTPKHDPGERKRHAAALPGLLKKLNAGFDEIGAAPTERKTFMDTLVDLQLTALRAEKQKPAAKGKPMPAPEERPSARGAGQTLQVSHATKSGVHVQDISLSGGDELDADNTPDRADLRRVRQLVRGDWVDFITAGQSRRERLTWINPSRTMFLFTNSASDCAISITPEALAVRLRSQTVRIVLPDRPMFERAIRGAIDWLDKHF
jgi:hypothetical protein